MLRALSRAGVTLAAIALLAAVALQIAHARGGAERLVGRVVIAHQDGARPGDSRLIPLLETTSGPVSLRLPQGLPTGAPGARVAIDHPRLRAGAIVGGGLALLGPPGVHSDDPNSGPANFTPGPKKVLVLLAQISGQPAPGSADAVRNVIFTAPNSVNRFVQEESFGQLSLTGKLRSDGDVSGPYPIANTASGTCNNVQWGKDAEAAFKATTGLDPETWDDVIVVFQYPTSVCNFSGVGEIGQLSIIGSARHAWINAVLTGGVPTVSVVAHELGHNFGVDHSGGLQCAASGVRISFSEVCAANPDPEGANQYLDPFDVMGNGVHEESAYHRWESGWMPSASVQTVKRSGTYLLAPVESSSSAVQLLEVPRMAGGPSYWLDFRQPFGSFFDSFAPTDPAVDGVTIRYANSSLMAHPSKSWLIDTTPATPSFADAPLAVGATYNDAYRGVSITTLAVSPLGALVRITVANGADTVAPGPISGLSAAVVGGTLRLSWNAAPDDSGPVQHYVVTRDGAPLADVYATSATDASPPPGRTSSYTVTPLDPSGIPGPPSTIQVAIADTTAPAAPADLAASVTGAGVRLSWSPAADDVGVASYEVDRDGQPIMLGLQTTVYTDGGALPGSHSYSVRATDLSGNVGPFSGAVTVELAGAAAAVVSPPPVKTAPRIRVLSTFTLKRIGKHRVLVSWKAQKGASGYQVLRATGKRKLMLATVRKARYLDGRAATGHLQKTRYVVRAVLPS